MSDELKILGPDGQPIRKQELQEEFVTTSLTSIRQPWMVEHIAGNTDPVSLANLMRSAAEGNAFDYLTLAEEMEEREWHYGSVLGTRKRAVSGLTPTIKPASDESNDVKIAEACIDLIEAPEFGELLDDCLDALGKGYAAIEIDWETSASEWTPKAYKWKDPRYFIYPQDNPYDLRMYDESDLVNGKPLPAYKFVIHRPRLKSGIPLRGGLARVVATAYMCKSYSLKDWLAFIEVFGLPMRIGRYGNNAKPDDIRILKQAVANLGSDAAAVLPDSMRVEFEQVANASGAAELFLSIAEWLDKQISKAVVGQTMTADDGSSQSQANVHNDVRIDILKSDVKQLCNTINRDLIKPYVDLNFGPQERYPRVQLPIEDAEDLEAAANVLEKLVPLGLKVSMSEVRSKHGYSEPKEDDELLSPQNPTAETQEENETALNHEQPDDADVLSTEFADDDWEEQLEVVNDVNTLIEQMLAEGKDLAEFKEELLKLATNNDPEFIDKLNDAMFRARSIGDNE